MLSKRRTRTQTYAFAVKGDSMPMCTRVHVYTYVHECTRVRVGRRASCRVKPAVKRGGRGGSQSFDSL